TPASGARPRSEPSTAELLPDDRESFEKMLFETIEKLRPLHRKLGPPRRGDWLDQHSERGQTFRQYLRSKPYIPDEKQNVIYIQPLGEFTPAHRRIVQLTAEFVELCFGFKVETKESLPISLIPDSARRRHPTSGDEQILTGYVIENILKPRLPEDACAYVCLTSSDLWPGEGWNFVFGQALIGGQLGVWSIYRFGDPTKSEEAFKKSLLRTLKIATHEIGHLFSFEHCIAYECNMCGTNHLDETDRYPLLLCPECVAKVCYLSRQHPLTHYRKLSKFCKQNGLKDEHELYEKNIKALTER
ncbi:MAG: archaemetzincin, partial [Planctomycetota bacterium]|nr:archaemetzincin [Planctomycetota bacterium]